MADPHPRWDHAVLCLDRARQDALDWYDEYGFEAGAETHRVRGTTLRGQRDPRVRVEAIPLDFRGRAVLHFGCQTGGILLHLASEIGVGVGLAQRSEDATAARALAEVHGAGNVAFDAFDFRDASAVSSLRFPKRFDAVIVTNVRAAGPAWDALIAQCVAHSNVLVFETEGSPAAQWRQLRAVTPYYAVTRQITSRSPDDSMVPHRRMYLCWHEHPDPEDAAAWREECAEAVAGFGDAANWVVSGGREWRVLLEDGSRVRYPVSRRDARRLSDEAQLYDALRLEGVAHLRSLTSLGAPHFANIDTSTVQRSLADHVARMTPRDDTWRGIVDDIAHFLADVHAVELGEVLDRGLLLLGMPRIVLDVPDAMSSIWPQDVAEWHVGFVHEASTWLSTRAPDTVLLHGGVRAEDIALDAAGELSEVGDLSQAGAGDPHLDLAGLASHIDPRVREVSTGIAQRYAEITGRDVSLDRVAFYASADVLRRALAQTENEGASQGLETLTQWVRRNR